MSTPLSRSTLALAFLGLSWGSSAPGQFVGQPAPTRSTYQTAQPRSVQRSLNFAPRQRANARPVLPYNRSPYTDDWSTGRHLPIPKPWMLPTRDPAARGR